MTIEPTPRNPDGSPLTQDEMEETQQDQAIEELILDDTEPTPMKIGETRAPWEMNAADRAAAAASMKRKYNDPTKIVAESEQRPDYEKLAKSYAEEPPRADEVTSIEAGPGLPITRLSL